MAILVDTRTGPVVQADGAGDQPLRQGRLGALIVTDGHSRLFEPASRRNLFWARAVVTAPVIFSTAAGTGGPLLWNGSSTVNAAILGVTVAGPTTATSVVGTIGLTGATGQTSAPTSTTAIDSVTNGYIGGVSPACTSYRVGTPTNAGQFYFPIWGSDTAATSVFRNPLVFDVAGGLVVPPNAWVSVSASATLTSGVYQIGLVWEEVPIGT